MIYNYPDESPPIVKVVLCSVHKQSREDREERTKERRRTEGRRRKDGPILN
jgi:hypothetical protein